MPDAFKHQQAKAGNGAVDADPVLARDERVAIAVHHEGAYGQPPKVVGRVPCSPSSERHLTCRRWLGGHIFIGGQATRSRVA